MLLKYLNTEISEYPKAVETLKSKQKHHILKSLVRFDFLLPMADHDLIFMAKLGESQ